MNKNLRDKLLEARAIILDEISKHQKELADLDALLGQVTKVPLRIHMARNEDRRRGDVTQVIEAVNLLGRANINEIASKVQQLHPVADEKNLLSKVSTYLKRLHDDGSINCDNTVKPKVYSSLGEIPK